MVQDMAFDEIMQRFAAQAFPVSEFQAFMTSLVDKYISYRTSAAAVGLPAVLKRPLPQSKTTEDDAGFVEHEAGPMSRLVEPGSQQNFRPVIGSGSTGIGKTQLIYDEGLHWRFCVFLRCHGSNSEPAPVFECATMLCQATEDIQMRACLVDLAILAYLSVAVRVLEFALSACPSDAHRLLLLAFRNSESDRRALGVYLDGLTSDVIRTDLRSQRSDEVARRLEAAKSGLSGFFPAFERPYLCIDEAQVLLGVGAGLFRPSKGLGERGLLHAVMQSAVRMCKLLRMGLYVTGTTFSLLTEVDLYSLNRLLPVCVSSFRMMQVADMLQMLDLYFHCDSDVFTRADVAQALDLYRGRPMFFMHSVFWRIVVDVRRNAAPRRMSAEYILEMARANLPDVLRAMAVRISKVLADGVPIGAQGTVTTSKVVATPLLKAALFSDGVVRWSETRALFEYIHHGIPAVHGRSEEANLNDEPATLFALRQFFMHDAGRYSRWMHTLFSASSFHVGATGETSGTVFEQLLAYHIACRVMERVPFPAYNAHDAVYGCFEPNGIELSEALGELCPYVQHLPCGKYVTRAHRVVYCGAVLPFLRAFLDERGEVDDTRILIDMDRQAGVDLAFIARDPTAGGAIRVVVVQAKNSRDTFKDALVTLHSQTQYLSNDLRNVLMAQRRLPDGTSVPKKHAEHVAFLEQHPHLGRNWIRVAWFGRQVSPELQDACLALSDPARDCTLVPPAVLERVRRSPILVLAPPHEDKLIASFLTLAPDTVSLPQSSLDGIVDPLEVVSGWASAPLSTVV
jgi:hypothetical protein